jgi:ABC-2 type transport system ATP-binding protein
MSAMIEIRGLTKRFGPIVAVDGISFSVERGEVLGFLGPNGAGKSTTMKMVTGYLPPSDGTAVVCGFDVTDQPIEVKRRVGYLPEGAPLYEDMTPLSFLGFVAEVRGLFGAAGRKAVMRAAELINLTEVMQQPIGTLSKGFKRRVGLAQAIVHDPEVLILDEPTDGLDPNQKHEVRELIARMAANKAIVISTHLLEEVHAICTRAVIIARGRVVADGTPNELEARSRFHNAVTLWLAADAAARAQAELGRIAGVEAVEVIETVDQSVRLLVTPRNGHTILPDVSARVRASGLVVNELRAERGHLDEVFRAITTGTTGH